MIEANIKQYIVEIEPGCWLARWRGDPGKTTRRDCAKQFRSKELASEAKLKAIRLRNYRHAKVILIKSKRLPQVWY